MEGNQMKMREALEWLLGFGYSTTDGGFHMPDAKIARNKIEAALASPPRNCDIGTVQERHRRFLTFCNAHIDCVDCPIKAHWTKALSCGILWDQMPYEAEEGGKR